MSRESAELTQKATCGPLFEKVRDLMNPICFRDFYMGFVTGHAEKVWMGAAKASMFRPPTDRWDSVMWCILHAKKIYDLHHEFVETSRGDEIWLYRDKDVESKLWWLGELVKKGRENTPEWHEIRGRLTGVPENLIDRKFHERNAI